MPARTPVRIRGAIIAVFSLLALALVLPSVSAQLRPPGSPQQPPTFPQPMPPGGNIPGSGNFTGTRPGGSMFERVWTCGKCGKEIGRGNFPPGTCQFCGTKLINGIGGGDKPIGGGTNPGMPGTNPAMPGMNPGMPTTPNPAMPPVVQPPMFPAAGPTYPDASSPPYTPPAYTPPVYTPSGSSGSTPATTESSGPSTGRLLIMIGAAVTGIMVLIVVVIAVIAIVSRSSKKRPAKRAVRRRPARRDRDDDDDD